MWPTCDSHVLSYLNIPHRLWCAQTACQVGALMKKRDTATVIWVTGRAYSQYLGCLKYWNSMKVKAYLGWLVLSLSKKSTGCSPPLAPTPSCAHHCTHFIFKIFQSKVTHSGSLSVRLCFDTCLSLCCLSVYLFVCSRGQAEALLCGLLSPAPVYPHTVHQPLPGPLHHLHHLHQCLHHEH